MSGFEKTVNFAVNPAVAPNSLRCFLVAPPRASALGRSAAAGRRLEKKVRPNGKSLSDCRNKNFKRTVNTNHKVSDGSSFAHATHRPEIRREYPLNLSISLSGGKETNKDSPSNGE